MLTFEQYRVEVEDGEADLVIFILLCWLDIQQELHSLISESRKFGRLRAGGTNLMDFSIFIFFNPKSN